MDNRQWSANLCWPVPGSVLMPPPRHHCNVLDSKKKIIGKKIPAEKLDEFLTQYEKFQKDKLLGKAKVPVKS